MKKLNKLTTLLICGVVLINSATLVFANPLDFGIFGGITEGRSLPNTTEEILKTNKANNKKNTPLESTYKEMLFLSGSPKEYNGIITVNSGEAVDENGTYKTSFYIKDGETTPEDISVNRKLDYTVTYRKDKNQTIKNFEINNWSENITLDGNSYVLDKNQSKSSISILEEKKAGITYYKGDISQRAVYKLNDESVTQEISGVIYGYTSAWSSTETQRLNCTVTTKDWQTQYELRPSVSVSKILDYSKNEPTAISFEGNYKEVMQNESGLSYNIFVAPPFAYNLSKNGNISVPNFNRFEQLVAPEMSHLKGHFAEEDIKKMFAMGIINTVPKFYKPNQAITRGEFTQMLVKAIKLPITPIDTKKPINLVFSDVMTNRTEYPYIMAGYDAEIVFGKDDGAFHIDEPIEREEAIVILLRTLGLERLGLSVTPMTAFVDDDKIDNWAKKEVYAANKIGIISGDENGKFHPKKFISKAEAAAIINRFINYMREDIKKDYAENIVNFPN